MKLSSTYQQLLSDIKQQITASRIQAIRAVNKHLIQLYWEIGKLIHEQQEIHGWGKSVVEKLSIDLQAALPREQ